MRKLSAAIDQVRHLPESRQELAAELLMNLVSGEAFPVGLDDGHLAEIEPAKDEADAGDFASDAEVAAVWKKHRA